MIPAYRYDVEQELKLPSAWPIGDRNPGSVFVGLNDATIRFAARSDSVELNRVGWTHRLTELLPPNDKTAAADRPDGYGRQKHTKFCRLSRHGVRDAAQ